MTRLKTVKITANRTHHKNQRSIVMIERLNN